MSAFGHAPRRRRRRWPRALLLVLLLAAAFVVGLSLGKALEERPVPGGSVTTMRTVVTVTETVTASP